MEQFGRSNLTYDWYACLPSRGADRLSPLRQHVGVEVFVDNEVVWLRGKSLDADASDILRSMLGCRQYRTLGDGQLVPEGKAIPLGYEPQGPWVPLRSWLTLVLPTGRFPIRTANSIPLKLARSSRVEPAALARLTRADWLSYAANAPQARLDRLVFATCDRYTVVHGQPIPPIRSTCFWLRDGVAAPVGFRWTPAVDAGVLKKMLDLEQGDIALLLPEGGSTVIRSEQFVAASRSAVRLTEGGSFGKQ